MGSVQGGLEMMLDILGGSRTCELCGGTIAMGATLVHWSVKWPKATVPNSTRDMVAGRVDFSTLSNWYKKDDELYSYNMRVCKECSDDPKSALVAWSHPTCTLCNAAIPAGSDFYILGGHGVCISCNRAHKEHSALEDDMPSWVWGKGEKWV